jgi:sRNA-binding carbon storage regulator CsrA
MLILKIPADKSIVCYEGDKIIAEFKVFTTKGKKFLVGIECPSHINIRRPPNGENPTKSVDNLK